MGISRAAVEAYKEAAAGRGAAAEVARKAGAAKRRMSLDEASKIMDVTTAEGQAAIEERFQILHKLNEPVEGSAGSPYLQNKISAAHKVLMEGVAKSEATPGSTEDKANKAHAKAEGDKTE